jgi:hypothetical protein
MSVINRNAPVVVADPGCDPGEPVAVEQFITDVLRRAHQTAAAVDDPDEARAILRVAQLFADDFVALVTAHIDEGYFAADGGIELVLLLGGSSLALALTGPGRFSADAALDLPRHSGQPAPGLGT